MLKNKKKHGIFKTEGTKKRGEKGKNMKKALTLTITFAFFCLSLYGETATFDMSKFKGVPIFINGQQTVEDPLLITLEVE